MFWDKIEKRETTGEGFNWTSWAKGEDYISNNSLNEQNYLRGLNILGNTIGTLGLTIKMVTENGEIEAINNPLNDLLIRPNSEMTRFDLLKSITILNKHQGASGIFIDRDFKGNPIGLYPCKIIQFTIDDAGLIDSTKQNKVLIDFECCGVQDSCLSKDMIILRDNSLDGINSKSTKNYIKETIDTNLKSQKYQNTLFSNGLTNKIVVQYTGDELKKEKDMLTIQEKFDRLYRAKNGTFSVPVGFSVQSLNLSLVDSQFAELKISGKKDIATALGIPFSLLDNGFLSGDENISYLTNTINPILTQLEQEMDYKLLGNSRKNGYKIRFNINSMLRTSPEKQKDILIDYVKNGIYTINQAKDILGVPRIEGGDTVLLPSGEVTLENLMNGQATWQKENNSNGQGGDNSGK